MPKLRVEQSEWQRVGPTLRKDYLYAGLAGESSRHAVRIDVDSSASFMGGTNLHVAILIRPHFWPMMPDGFLVAQLAETDHLANAPFATVRIGTCDDGSMLVQPTEREGAEAFARVLMRGTELRLALLNESEALAQLPIPNHPQAIEAFRDFMEAGEISRNPGTPARESTGSFWGRLLG